MDFREIAKKRCSVRSYEDRPVEMEKLIQILESGRYAPTGANRQPQRLIVVKETDDLARLAGGANTFKAPLAIIVCADHGASWKRSYDRKDIADIDASIVTDHMMLQATDLGLGSCWICHFNPEVIRKEFNIPAQVEKFFFPDVNNEGTFFYFIFCKPGQFRKPLQQDQGEVVNAEIPDVFKGPHKRCFS